MAKQSPALRAVSLDDKYALDATDAYLTGIEALVRLPILQHQRDLRQGLNTAGLVSGYRGSPLAGLDQALWRAKPWLERHNVRFNPGLNEELAATAVSGSQQLELHAKPKFDGVFGMWYGKGPGVDRSVDAFRHANACGTARHGGVLAVAGDDHACKSSTLPHQSEYVFIATSMPVLNPANVQEVLDFGIQGWALSRYSGCWVGLKAITETADAAMVARIDPDRVRIRLPEDFELSAGGLHARWPDQALEQEIRLSKHKLGAARAFARANGLDRVVMDSPNARFGILTTGKAYLDVLQALEDLGIDAARAHEIGLRILKVGMSWPLEPTAVHAFAKGLEDILVVEEKRPILEDQLTSQLYNNPVASRPRVVGEFDEAGEDLVPSHGELTPALVARAIAQRLARFHDSKAMQARLDFLDAKERSLARPRPAAERTPHFCSGCPHNSSTKVPEGSHALGGIGCHYMATWMPDRPTLTYTQMGGEGAAWIGQAPFTHTPHVFQNLGDGTYFHSGSLAIRAALAAGVNITFKILYNEAVAMTGGQPIDGNLPIDALLRQLEAEGVKRIVLVSDDPDAWQGRVKSLPGCTVHHRTELDALQRDLRTYQGVSVIVHAQPCAAERRRRRKRGLVADPPVRAFINEAVCEGCGDCGTASNCLSVVPSETELGRKRRIDQGACNKDFSCLNGFCPSFVTVHGGTLAKTETPTAQLFDTLPEPHLPALDQPWNAVLTGVGGTGVVTLTALVAMAAHLEGKGCATLNQTGLAQKFGAVISHLRIAPRQDAIKVARVPAGQADLLLGCDLAVSASFEALAKVDAQRTQAVVNSAEQSTAAFVHDPDLDLHTEAMQQTIRDEAGSASCRFIDATAIAGELLGDPIAANLFLLGFAWQHGLIPVGRAALERAIELNGVAVDANLQAFLWGRRAAHAPQRIPRRQAGPAKRPPRSLEALIKDRSGRLRDYQNAAYAEAYDAFVQQVRNRDADGEQRLTRAVAISLHKLMAYKDEYEVARLYSDGAFARQLRAQFSGDYRLRLHLAPPLLAKRDPATGHPVKRAFPGWTLKLFGALAKLRFLRGTAWDPFGRSGERRRERQDIDDYRGLIEGLLPHLTDGNYDQAVELAQLPMQLRGFGHIKDANRDQLAVRRGRLLRAFSGTGTETAGAVRIIDPTIDKVA